jgi:hypothetical protein
MLVPQHAEHYRLLTNRRYKHYSLTECDWDPSNDDSNKKGCKFLLYKNHSNVEGGLMFLVFG